MMRDVDSGFVRTTDGVRLYWEAHGHGHAHLIVPGAVLVEDDLLPLVEGRTVVFFDPRNRGRSDAVPLHGDVGLPVEVEDVEAIRRHFGLERFSLFGWSQRGPLVALYAARYPSRVDCLVMVCPVPPRDQDYGAPHSDLGLEAALAYLETLRQSGLADRDPVEFARQWRRAFVPTRMGDPSAFANLKSDPSECPNEWPDHARAAQERVWDSLGAGFDFRSTVAAVVAPTLIVHGEADVIPVTASREWAEAIPRARLVTFPGVGHFPWAEAPQPFFDVVHEFLRDPLTAR